MRRRNPGSRSDATLSRSKDAGEVARQLLEAGRKRLAALVPAALEVAAKNEKDPKLRAEAQRRLDNYKRSALLNLEGIQAEQARRQAEKTRRKNS